MEGVMPEFPSPACAASKRNVQFIILGPSALFAVFVLGFVTCSSYKRLRSGRARWVDGLAVCPVATGALALGDFVYRSLAQRLLRAHRIPLPILVTLRAPSAGDDDDDDGRIRREDGGGKGIANGGKVYI
uniref:Uncharacterized protein n=1 Tax=Anopheles farauti TaxID=69004 RepID=A0A182QNM9_9DIPT